VRIVPHCFLWLPPMRSFVSLVLLSVVSALYAAELPAPHRGRIVLVGDSTMTDKSGWGRGFKAFVDDSRAECINTAVGGRSSMSFIHEGHWAQALSLHADYYLIQFGHNDEPGKGSERATSIEEYRHYMQQYVADARAIGARPILITSLVRRKFDKNDPHQIVSSLASRAEAVKEIAAASHVPVVDLHARSKALCEKLGRDACYEFSPTKPEDGSYDTTHLKPNGSLLFAGLIVADLHDVCPDLGALLREQPGPLPPAAEPPEIPQTAAKP
jgi:lysophospholipase L1-like esterase